MHMPSGNSTFWEVPSADISHINELIFKPYFKVQFTNSSAVQATENKENKVLPSIQVRNEHELNTILFGPPGTGKTYETISLGLKYLGENLTGGGSPQEIRLKQKKRFAELQLDGKVFFTTFHQNLAYEDFIEGIKPQKPRDKEESLKYVIEDGLFMRACVEATFDFMVCNFEIFHGYREIGEDLDPESFYEYKKKHVQSFLNDRGIELLENDHSSSFVFIIDEINRGNVSQIFGELITLIEPDKRLGNKEVLYIDLPYSKNAFSVPPNLYIIGTMNTADRSVEALDTALRRRFSFKAMMPKPEELKSTTDGIDLPAMLRKLNERLAVLKDTDHTIGHAWLWNVNDIDDLRTVYENKILPLLQEFFYNDYEKLGLVLGDSFFEGNTQVSSGIFAKFSAGNGIAGQYEQVWQYNLKKVEKLKAEDFQSIYSKLT